MDPNETWYVWLHQEWHGPFKTRDLADSWRLGVNLGYEHKGVEDRCGDILPGSLLGKRALNGVLQITSDDAEDATDYKLKDGQLSVWIEVGNIAVHILRTDEGVAVDLYPNGYEMDDTLTSCSATFIDSDELVESIKRGEVS